MSDVLAAIRGGLVVSVQADAGSALDDPAILVAIARAAQDAGAAGVRMQGAANLHAARAALDVPIIGIVKRAYDGFEPYITPTLREVEEVMSARTAIVATDATQRARPGGVRLEALIEAIHAGGALAMADCSTVADGERALAARADILATTLSGYTKETRGRKLPALDVVTGLARLHAFVICEGGIHSPTVARATIDAGADCVVVGTAITNVQWLTRGYVEALA